MAIERMTDKRVGEEIVRQVSQRYEGGFRPDATDMVNHQPAPYMGELSYYVRDANLLGPGTQMSNIVKVLECVRLRSKRNGQFYQPIRAKYQNVNNIRQLLKKASLTNPIIARVYWGNDPGAGHFVVVDGHKSRFGRGNDRFCISDPWYGVSTTKLANEPRPPYSPNDGQGNPVEGYFDGQIITLRKVWIRDQREERLRRQQQLRELQQRANANRRPRQPQPAFKQLGVRVM